MDSCEATQMVFARVKSMEPDNVTRIMGYLLLHDTDMFDLAFTTDSELKSAISSAKKQIDLPMEQRLVSDRENPPPFAKNESDKSLPQSGKLSEKRESEMRFLFDLEKDKRFLTESDKRFAESDKRFLSGNEKRESEKRFWSNAEKRDPEKRFLSDNMGLCKNGTVKEEAFSIEELEMELLELLRSRKGIPISISTLPQLYYERFGKRLDSDAYGKNGYGLSKLLSRLSGRLVSLAERPHGQHALMLADDVHKYFVHKAEFDADNFYSGCSRQIYLTFPPDSNFNEEDVTTHFSAYGPVQDVRIPTQHRRMFGFVTFVYTETARLVLAEGNPHHVCGARVLVKPYREKSKPLPRKQQDLEKLFHANDQPKVPSLIGSDAERRLKEEERMVEMEMRMAQIHLRARAEAEAAAAALLTVNLKNRGLQNIQRDPSAFLDIMDVRSPPRPKNGLQNIQPDSSAFVNNYMMDVHSPPPQQRNGVQNFQTDPSAFLDNYMMEIRSPPGFHKTQPDPSAFLDDYMMDVHSPAPRPCLPGAPSRDVHSTPPRSCVSGAPFMDVRSTALSPSVPGAAMDFHSSEPHTCAPGAPVPFSNGFQIPKANVYQLNRDGTCCICFEYFMDLVLLECNHKFCMQCFMKLVKSSKDECPICSWN